MKIPSIKTALAVMAALAIGTSSASAETDMSAGVRAGTLGFGPEVKAGLTPFLDARIGYNWFSYDGDVTKSGIKYDYDLKLSSIPVMLDLHPLPVVGLRVSAGILVNGNEIKAKANPSGSVEIGDTDYTADQVGRLDGKVDFNDVAPVLALGWDQAFGPLSFSVEAGVVFQGTPDVSLTASGPISDDPLFQAELQKEIDDLKDDIDWFQYYPMLSLGMSYRF